MRKRIVMYTYIIVTLLFLTGCGLGAGEDISGTWLIDSGNIPEEFGRYVFTTIPISFWEDGTFGVVKKDGEVWTSGEYEYSKGKLIVRTITILSGTHSTYEYSYKCSIKGDKLMIENGKGKITLTRQE